jgi:hypothetical protein
MAKKKHVLRCEVVYNDQKITPDVIAEMLMQSFAKESVIKVFAELGFKINMVYYPYKKENK